MLNRNVRLTDHKAQLSPDRFAVLFTDTPEMGGRSAMGRIESLLHARGVSAEMQLEIHDPEGFDDGFGNHDSQESDYRRSGQNPIGDRSSGVVGRRKDDYRSESRSGSNAVQHHFSGSGSVVGALERPAQQDVIETSSPTTASGPWNRVGGQVDIGSDVSTCHLSQTGRFIKRSVDIAGASFGLCLGGPVILAAMAAVRWTDGQSALFKQTREGYLGKPFTIYKLRTMVVDAESQQDQLRGQSHRDGPAFKITHDPRVTKVGHFLRKTCLDELPQLWNVLKGDMSLVGPRPLPWHESRACEKWHRRRLDVRPGMTCYWQVDKDRVETFDDWMRMDLRDLERPTLWVDLRLIVRTVAVPLLGRGSH